MKILSIRSESITLIANARRVTDCIKHELFRVSTEDIDKCQIALEESKKIVMKYAELVEKVFDTKIRNVSW